MIQPCQVAAPFQILNARNGIAFFFSPHDGTIQRIDLALKPANINGAGDAVFDVKKNGVSIFGSPTDRPKIVAGQSKGHVDGLSVAVLVGDIIEFDAATIPAGGLQGPVMLQATIDDGVVAGAGAPGGDLGGVDLAHAVVESIRTVPVKAFGSSTTFSDDFNDGVFDTSKWGRDDSTAVTESGGAMQLTGGHNAYWATAHNMTNHSIQAKLTISSGGTVFFRVMLDTGVDYIECRLSPNSGYTRLGRHSPGAGDEWTVNTSYDSVNDLWLKVAHQSSDNTWHFYTSPDGATWTDRGNCAPPDGATCTSAIFYVYCIGGTLAMDNFASTIPDTSEALSDGDALVYNSTSGQFENRVPGQVHIVTGLVASSAPPANLLPGQSAIAVDLVNHRMGFWNPNTSTWDWKSFPNS